MTVTPVRLPPRPCQARGQPHGNRIARKHVDLAAHEMCESVRDLRRLRGYAEFDRIALALDETTVSQPSVEAREPLLRNRADAQEADALDRGPLLRVREDRARKRRAGDESDERTPLHSIKFNHGPS